MADKDFDPRKFIDREVEAELFEELLQFKMDDRRILAIRDGGMGKTQLLQKLQYRCRTVRPRTPVSFIALDQLRDNQPLTLIARMVQDLSEAFDIQFPKFEMHYTARVLDDFGPIRASIYFEKADFQGAQDVRIADRQTNIDCAGTVIIALASRS